MTNIEWLRSLNAIDLAKVISQEMCFHCVYFEPIGCSDSEHSCVLGTLDWLFEEHKESV